MKIKEIADSTGHDYKFIVSRGQGYLSVFCPTPVDTIIANKVKQAFERTTASITDTNIIRISGSRTTVNFFFKGLDESDHFANHFSH